MSLQSTERPPAPAQVRLSPEEWDSLTRTMRVLGLNSTSEALREALRLLHREAREIEATREIREFYGDHPVPPPEAAAPVTQADLDAADQSEW